MHRRFYAQFAPLVLLPLLAGGCVQATRHSNVLIFGTNTSFGIKVGTDATEIPSIMVGYNRQEAVIVPLVANTRDAGGTANRLIPCDLNAPIAAPAGGQFIIHPCSLVGVNGKALDSYSVLASFGAQFDASGGTTNGVKGGLAQYFATGIAAQLLAATGGASVVAVGDSATVSAIKAPSAEEAIKALYGDNPAFKTGVGIANTFEDFMGRLQAKMTLTDPQQLKAKVGAFELASGSLIKIADLCTDVATCKLNARNAYSIGYQRDAQKFEQALAAW